MKNPEITIMFDNGGGATLNLNNQYAHYYDDMGKLAEEYVIIRESPDEWEDWDNNEIENWDEPDTETERNGGAVWYTMNDIHKLITNKPEYYWGGNVEEFIEALRK